ncbi:MAG: M28 family peptidase [Clostridiales bacterium]|jgi:hypothetical protein|nr:M28 family peptidase [Clostridiales bacterium]
MKKSVKTILASVLSAAVLAAGVGLGMHQISAPSVPAGFQEAPTVTDGSTEPTLNGLLGHLKNMTAVPHEAGSDRNAVVREYLANELRKLGYEPVRESYSLTVEDIVDIEKTHRNPFRLDEQEIRDYANMGDRETLELQNLTVKLDAPDTDEAVVVVAHYDSVKFGPGAADDLLSVTAILESLREADKIAAPKNDVYILFSDGEEQGLLGAACFVDDHPELKDKVRFVVNFEARGNQGAQIMFETSDNNLELVRHYKKAVPDPVSLSIGTAVYRMMSNDTDLSEFFLDGYAGLNFACIEGAEVYHTAQDNFDTLNRGTAQHYLDTVSSVLNYVRTADLSSVAADQDGVFFPLLRGNLVLMSATTARVIAAAAALLAAVWIVFLLLRRKVRSRDLLKVLGVQLGAMAVTGLLGLGVVKIAGLITGPMTSRQYLGWGPAMPIFLIMLAVGLAVTVLGLIWIGRKLRNPLAVTAGVMPLLTVLAAGTAVAFNAASYLFSLPLLALLIFALLYLLLKKRNSAASVVGAVGLVVIGLLALLLFVPIVYLVYVALAFPAVPVAAALAVIPLSVAAASAAGLLHPAQPESDLV